MINPKLGNFVSPRPCEIDFDRYDIGFDLLNDDRRPLYKLDLSIPHISDFIGQIAEQARRITPTFTFSNPLMPPLNQAFFCFKQAVDFYLNSKVSFHSKNTQSLDVSIINESFCPRETEEDVKNFEKTFKNLRKYDFLLKKRENDLKSKELHITTQFNCLEDDKIYFYNIQKTFNIEKIKWEDLKKHEQAKIDEDKKKLYNLLDNTTKIKEDLETQRAYIINNLKSKEQELNTKQKDLYKAEETLSQEKNVISQERLKLSQEKWNLDQLKFKIEEEQAILKIKAEHLELEKSELTHKQLLIISDQKAFQELKNEFLKTKEMFLKRKNNFSDPENKFSYNEHTDINITRISNEDSIKSSSIEFKHQNISDHNSIPCIDLQAQTGMIEKNLEEKELMLKEREEDLNARQVLINNQFSNLQAIELSLVASKLEIENFRMDAIPYIESYSKALINLIQDLTEKKNEVISLIKRLYKDLNLVKRYRLDLETIKEHDIEASSNDSADSISKNLDCILESIESKFKLTPDSYDFYPGVDLGNELNGSFFENDSISYSDINSCGIKTDDFLDTDLNFIIDINPLSDKECPGVKFNFKDI